MRRCADQADQPLAHVLAVQQHEDGEDDHRERGADRLGEGRDPFHQRGERRGGGLRSPRAAAAPGPPRSPGRLIASAALPSLPSLGARSARILALMFSRYSGSLAASDTAWLAANQPTAPMSEKPSTTTMKVAGTRPSRQRSSRRTAGASRKRQQDGERERDQHLAREVQDRRRDDEQPARSAGARSALGVRRHRSCPQASSNSSSERAGDLVLVADREARLFRGVREVGVGEQRPALAAVRRAAA